MAGNNNRPPKWIRSIPRLTIEERRKIIADVQDDSKANFDYLILVALSSSIATLGLLSDSPAVIIGAMVVAPLMSPILAIGLATTTGAKIFSEMPCSPSLLARSCPLLFQCS